MEDDEMMMEFDDFELEMEEESTQMFNFVDTQAAAEGECRRSCDIEFPF